MATGAKENTVLEIAKALHYRLNLPLPNGGSFTLVNPTDQASLQIRQLIYDVCQELRSHCCFTQQKRSYSFETTASRYQYPLPQDFWSLNLLTMWNDDQELRLVGPVPDGQWTYLKQRGQSYSEFAVRFWGGDSNPNTGGGQIELDPVPEDGQDISFEYFTSSLFLPVHWAPSTAYTSGVHVSVSNNIYLCDTNGTSGSTPPSTKTNNIDDGTTRWDYEPEPYLSIAVDTDKPIFDPELVKFGIRAGWKEEKGEDRELARAEFEARIRKAKSRFHGPVIGSFAGEKAPRRRYEVPYRNWPI